MDFDWVTLREDLKKQGFVQELLLSEIRDNSLIRHLNNTAVSIRKRV